MESRNPVLVRMEKEAQRNGGYAGFGAATATATAPAAAGYDVPPTQPVQVAPSSSPMTINDVIVRTAAMFVPLLITAYITWTIELSYGYVIIALLVGLGLGLWGALSSKIRPAVYLAYAAVQGVVIGGLSLWFQTWVDESNLAQGTETTNIVAQAVIGTFGAFAAMLFLYATRIIKVTGKFKKMMAIALVAYLGIAVLSLFSAFIFGTGDGWGFFGVDGIGILLCLAGVALASFSLALDFDAIEQGVALGLPEQESWRAAFGLVVTLIWLYLEILRFLAILNSD
jgi:uncharacterized YccA/Bax inhibitor family protein